METFIRRHGYVQYSVVCEGFPRPPIPRCETCLSASHRTYQFDHCHRHGWVRGFLCASCNSEMTRIDRGVIQTAHYMMHWAKCPDCRDLGILPVDLRELAKLPADCRTPPRWWQGRPR